LNYTRESPRLPDSGACQKAASSDPEHRLPQIRVVGHPGGIAFHHDPALGKQVGA